MNHTIASVFAHFPNPDTRIVVLNRNVTHFFGNKYAFVFWFVQVQSWMHIEKLSGFAAVL